MDVALVMFKADGTRRDFPLGKSRIVIGRTNTCDLRIPVSSVSRQHCEVRLEDGVPKVRDLGSSNGTFHNNNRITEAVVAAGDELVVGPVVFTVVIDGVPADIKPVRTLVGNKADDGATPSPTLAAVHEDIPQTLSDDSGDDLPAFIEPESNSPTVDLDDDPIAALEALANAEDEPKPRRKP